VTDATEVGTTAPRDATEAAAVIAATLTERGIDYERTAGGGFVATLPGERKQKTLCNLIPGEHALRIEAFVMRHPDENREALYEFLLQRNARMYGVAFSIDQNGDVYLVGRVALHSVTPDELDRLLGAVLEYADGTFNLMLEIGFASAIRREWAWRVKNGESLANLAAFAHWAADGGPPAEV
jgi:hypothetical protein